MECRDYSQMGYEVSTNPLKDFYKPAKGRNTDYPWLIGGFLKDIYKFWLLTHLGHIFFFLEIVEYLLSVTYLLKKVRFI